MTDSDRRRRPVPSIGLLAGTLVALGGYLLPWFKADPSYGWWYSGLGYATDVTGGGGWTLWTFVFLALALVTAVWAGDSDVAAGVSVVSTVVAGVFAFTVVAASLAASSGLEDRQSVVDLPFGFGIPLMAVGFGSSLVAGTFSLASMLVRDAEARLRR